MKEEQDLTTEQADEELNKRACVITYDESTNEVEVDWDLFNGLEIRALLRDAIEVVENDLDPDDD